MRELFAEYLMQALVRSYSLQLGSRRLITGSGEMVNYHLSSKTRLHLVLQRTSTLMTLLVPEYRYFFLITTHEAKLRSIFACALCILTDEADRGDEEIFQI